jgi:hypothetical protein
MWEDKFEPVKVLVSAFGASGPKFIFANGGLMTQKKKFIFANGGLMTQKKFLRSPPYAY